MKQILIATAILFSGMVANAQAKETKSKGPDKDKKLMTVEASCGQCKLGLEGDDCNLAVRIDGKAYFVDGSSIDDHGDAHADDGFCSAIRKAEVQGDIVDNRFKATYFKLLPEQKEHKKDH